MDEVRRFMRYVLPGLVCILELVIADYLTGMKLFGDLWKLSKDSASVAVASFLASGALGYIFSNIYFEFRDFFGMRNDHQRLLEEIIRRYGCKINITNEKEEPRLIINNNNLGNLEDWSIHERWEIFNLALHSFRKKSALMNKFEKDMERLLDVLHSFL